MALLNLDAAHVGGPNGEVVKLDTNAAISVPRLLALFLTTADLSPLLHFFVFYLLLFPF